MRLLPLVASCIRFVTLWTLCAAPGVVAQQSPADLMQQADAAYRAGELPKAAALFRKVLQLDPSAMPAHMFLGIITSQGGQWSEAIGHFRAVVEAAPGNAHAHFFLGAAYAGLGKWAEAARSYSEALDRQFPDRSRLLVELAVAQAESGDPEQALSTLRSIEPPSDKGLASEYHAAQALAHQRMDQPTQAIEAIRRALENNSYDARHRYFLVAALLSIGQVQIALAEAIDANKLFPDHPDIQYQYGIAGSFVPELPFTATALRNLREAGPNDPRVLLLEGLMSNQRGETKEALEAFRAAAAQGVREAHLQLGLALHEQGDQAAAEKELRQALRHFPHDGQVFLALGRVLTTRNPEEALTFTRKAEAYMPMNPTLHYGLAGLYRRLNQPEKSAHHLELFRKYKQEEDQLLGR